MRFALSLGVLACSMTVWACGGNTDQAAGAGWSAAGSSGVGGSGGDAGPEGGAVGGSGGTGEQCPAQISAGKACKTEGGTCSYMNRCGSIRYCSCINGRYDCDSYPGQQGCPVECPKTVPSAGEECSATWAKDFRCWYGGDARPYCRDQAQCENGHWTMNSHSSSCPAPSNACPSDPDNPPDGVCGDGATLYCDYGGGVGCSCESTGMQPMDGGAALTWSCFKPPSGACPKIIPNAGDLCYIGDSGGECEYGSGCTRYTMECKSPFTSTFGAWEIVGQTVCD
jgi:hypothetical protein